MSSIASIDSHVPHRVRSLSDACALCANEDIDVAEISDFFTATELISYESVGLANGSRQLHTARGKANDDRRKKLFAKLGGGAVDRVDGARISLAHNIVGSAGASTAGFPKGATDGAG